MIFYGPNPVRVENLASQSGLLRPVLAKKSIFFNFFANFNPHMTLYDPYVVVTFFLCQIIILSHIWPI